LGKPDKVTAGDNGATWKYDAEDNGISFEKLVIFENSRLKWWKKETYLRKIKTRQREDNDQMNYLDDDVSKKLRAGMSKTKVYRKWGLPWNIETTSFSDKKIDTEWWFKTDGSYSHRVIFKNNKLEKWGDVGS
jgi:hypothetical protein